MVTRCARPWAFTLLELLVCVAVLAVLLAILLPALGAAREQSRTSVCGSNLRQLAIADLAYAAENAGRFCPGAPGMATQNLRRWHGARTSVGAPFDPARGPLAPHLGADGRVKACPSFRDFVRDGALAFEAGNGGYGYNQAYLGRVLRIRTSVPPPGGSGQVPGGAAAQLVTDELGALLERIRRTATTLLFADAALAAPAAGVIEYSFAEPRFQPEFVHLHYRADPSLHFRHRGSANVAWADGHVDRRRRTFTWHSGVYAGDPDAAGIGWFGREDDNGFFAGE